MITREQLAAESRRNIIIESAARAFYVSTWADVMEQRHGRIPCAGPGVDLMTAAPPTSRAARRFAERFVRRLEEETGARIEALFGQEAAKDKHRKLPTPDDFGHYLAMQAMGHGVSWADDHPELSFAVPYWPAYDLTFHLGDR